MPTLNELDNQLTTAANILDMAAATIRDCSLQPTQDHIRRIGEALAHIFDIQRAIYALRPDLTPGILRDASQFAEANGRLTVALSNSYKLGEAGQFAEAERVLTEYIASESSDRHRAIAQMLLDRHRASDAT
jgi:hypothetical protein